MSITYSPATQGFYTSEMEYSALPADLVEITVEQYRELMAGQSSGLRIVTDDNGFPGLVNPQDLLSPEERLAHAKQLKQKAIEQARDQALAAGIVYQRHHYATDLTTQATLLTAQQMASMTQEAYPVFDVNDNVQRFTAEQLTALLKTIASHYRQVTKHTDALCKALAAAQTMEAIAAITITFTF